MNQYKCKPLSVFAVRIWCPVLVIHSRFRLHSNSTRAKLMHKHLSNSVQIWTVMCWDCFDILNLKSWSFFIHIHVMPLMPHVCLGLPNQRSTYVACPYQNYPWMVSSLLYHTLFRSHRTKEPWSNDISGDGTKFKFCYHLILPSFITKIVVFKFWQLRM